MLACAGDCAEGSGDRTDACAGDCKGTGLAIGEANLVEGGGGLPERAGGGGRVGVDPDDDVALVVVDDVDDGVDDADDVDGVDDDVG